METLHESAVCVDISVAFKADLDTEKEEIFAKDFLASFPTQRSSAQPNDSKKRADISKLKASDRLENSTEKSPRQARRNARERGRKARLNAAFQVLRSIVPHADCDSAHEQRKLTQVEILRLAKNYICSLTTILQTCNDNIATSYQDRGSFCAGDFFANMN